VRVSRIAAAVRVACCAGILLAVWPADLAEEDELAAIAALPVKPIRWPSLRSGPLQDNSFLIEEAYNQEPGVVQHINSVLYDRASGGWLANFTQEWPLGGQRHQLSCSVPFSWLGDGGRGPGDVLLNYRYQLLTEQGRRPAGAHGAAYRNRAIFPPGIPVGRNCVGGVQAVWGIAFPLGVAGNRGPLGILLYFSIEQGFTSKAREERRWQ